MSSEEHPSRIDLAEWLRRGDPYRGERLDRDDRAAIREAMMRTHAAASRRRRRRLAAAACLLIALLLAPILGETLRSPAPGSRPVPPPLPEPTVRFALPHLDAAPSLANPETATASVAGDRALPDRRSIRFTAPGGTRIVWTLDPAFELDPATR